MNSAEEFYENLISRKSDFDKYQGQILSESDTRVKLIDSIFVNCMGWDENNIKREESYNGSEKTQYIDYIYISDNNKFLIEAKRKDIYFNIPINDCKLYKSSGVIMSDIKIKKALEQAKKYCRDKGINVGCITNGSQFIIFSIISLNSKFDLYCFKSIDDVISNATTFYNFFSYTSNAQSVLENIFSSNNIRSKPSVLRAVLEIFPDRNETIARNPIDAQIRPILRKYFSDLSSDNLKMLEECYCSEERYSQYENQIRELLKDNIPSLDTPVQSSKYFHNDFMQNNSKNKTMLGINSVMVLVGGVGSGKTTFLEHFYHIVLNKNNTKNLLWLYLDFTRISKEDIEAINLIYLEILKQFDDKYNYLNIYDWENIKKVYQPLVTRLKNGPLKPYYTSDKDTFEIKLSDILYQEVKNKIEFSKHILKYLELYTDYTITLVIDNADQKSDEFQKKMLMAAHEFSKNNKCITLISMREESYWKFKNINPLDAYQGYAYHISSPSVAKLISKRMDYAIKEIGNKIIRLTMPNGANVNISFKEFITMVKDSLESKDNNLVNIELFENLSSNNMRYATDILQSFLTSGHTNTMEYILYYIEKGKYTIPKHAFIRSISLGDYKYYHSNKSNIFNILLIEDDGFYSHFNKLRILKYLNNNIQIESFVGKGFVKITELYSTFSVIYSTEIALRNTLELLMKNRLILVDKGYNTLVENADYIKITSAGYYYLNDLLYEFSYMERLLEDTPLTNYKYYEELVGASYNLKRQIDSNASKSAIMFNRKERITIFLNYLIEEEEKESNYLEGTEINYKFIEKCKKSILSQIK